MILEVPRYRENSSSLELERMIKPLPNKKEIVFYSWDRYDYSYLVEARTRFPIAIGDGGGI